jgi:hypothetical protein
MKPKRKYTATEVKRFIRTMKAAKAAEADSVRIYSDALLLVTVVVEIDGEWWLVPRSRDGWQRRQRLTLTPLAETERLTPAVGISPEWLGITAERGGDQNRLNPTEREQTRNSLLSKFVQAAGTLGPENQAQATESPPQGQGGRDSQHSPQ